jgi:trigger factor
MESDTDKEIKINPLERKLKIEVLTSDVALATSLRLKKMGKTLKIPGFRPGKVPLSVVEKNYGSEAQSESINDAINEAYMNLIAKEKLIPAGPPKIEPVTKTSESNKEIEKLEFEAVFEVMPQIDIPDRNTLKVKKSITNIVDADIDRTIESLRRQKIKYIAVDRVCEKNDQVTVDFLGTLEGNEFKGGKANDVKYILGSGQMIAEFDDLIVGMKSGETKNDVVIFPTEYPAKEIAGKKVDFKITLKLVEDSVLPELNDDFAKVYGVAEGGITKLRLEVETNLKREALRRCQTRTHNSALEALMDGASFQLPIVMVDKECVRLAQRTNAEMKEKGVNSDNSEFPPEIFKDRAEKRVKLGLVVNEVIRKEKLDPSEDQISIVVDDMSTVYEDPDEFKKWFLQDPKRKSQAEAVALERNVASWILEKALTEEVEVKSSDLLSDSSKGAEVGGEKV